MPDLPGQSRPEVFPTVAELARRLDIADLATLLQRRELIGIDESQVDSPLPHSALTFLKSVAFRMYHVPGHPPDEQAGPIVSEMRMRLSEDESFESKNKLIGYIRNNFVAYVSGLTALAFGRSPYIVLHGPLVRAIGGFSGITFDYTTARELFNINLAEAGEFEVPTGKEKPVVTGDAATRYNLPLVSQDAVDGDKNLRKFNEFCLMSCGRQCAQRKVFPDEAVPPARDKVNREMLEGRSYPGFCLYFWMLRSLLDLCRLSGTVVVSVVEDVSAATEMTRLVLPSLLGIPAARAAVSTALTKAMKAISVTLPTQPHQRGELYRRTMNLIERLTLSDSNIFSYVLSEGEYTATVQAYRYQTQNTFLEALADTWLGIPDNFRLILDALFPTALPMTDHPGYRVLMSYLRTTPLREPVRVEYFDLTGQQEHKRIMGSVYLLSLPYQEYGIPVLLYYADKLARTPTKLIRTIIELEYMDLVLQNRFSDPVSILRVLGRLTRGYFQREGLQ
ncbi:MAG: DNA double-strand break repair nuclease NurA [Isosphaeraceae bacterium]